MGRSFPCRVNELFIFLNNFSLRFIGQFIYIKVPFLLHQSPGSGLLWSIETATTTLPDDEGDTASAAKSTSISMKIPP